MKNIKIVNSSSFLYLKKPHEERINKIISFKKKDKKMKMKKNIVLFSLIVFNMKIVYSSSFCTDPEDYECKHLGISKCVPKLNRSTTKKPLPIEKPPCAVPCIDTDPWCEERGACIAKDEHCDCGPDKIYCTSEDAYSCESRKGILQSHIFKICRNGECRKNCSMAEEEGMEGGGGGQFRCGRMCLDTVKVVQNRTCNQQCISVHKTCYTKQEEVSAVINDSEKGFSSHWIYVICLCVSWVLTLVLLGISCHLYYRVQYLNNTTTDRKNISEESGGARPGSYSASNIVDIGDRGSQTLKSGVMYPTLWGIGGSREGTPPFSHSRDSSFVPVVPAVTPNNEAEAGDDGDSGDFLYMGMRNRSEELQTPNSKRIQYLKNTTTDHKTVGSDSDEDFQLNSDFHAVYLPL